MKVKIQGSLESGWIQAGFSGWIPEEIAGDNPAEVSSGNGNLWRISEKKLL